MQRIEFYFGPISPFAYLGSVQIERLAARLRPRAVRYTELAPGRLKNLWRYFDDGYNFSAADNDAVSRGFNSTFIKAIAKLERAGRVEPGLTFHGLRHTCGTLLVEAGFDIDSVRRWLGQKTLAMAIHYTETADTSVRMRGMMKKFDPLGSKKRT